MISKYKIFTEYRELSMINETVVYIIKDLLKILKKLENDKNETISGIAKDILSLRGKDIDQDVTMLNIDEKEPGFVTFTSFKNIKNNFKNTGVELDNYFTNTGIIDSSYIQAVWDESSGSYPNIRKSRTPTRIGRLLNSLFPKKYIAKDVELFTNAFKAMQENLAEKISIVEGYDIKFWYNEDNYAVSSGSLGNSCMKKRRTVFDIYTNNPEVCRMVIITEDNKLVGRALLWKVEGQEFEYFLDRQYTTNDALVAKFRKYADDNGFAYKTRNNHSSYREVTYKGESKEMGLTIKVKPYEGSYKYSEYPYMDTFRRYDPKKGILYNDDEKDGNIGQYLLDDTEGGYNQIEDTVYSDYYDDYVSRQSAIWSEPLRTYLDRYESIEITAGSNRRRGWYPSDYDDITHDCITEIPYHTDDCTYSDFYNDYIYEDDEKKVVKSISRDGSVDMTIISDKDDDVKSRLIPIKDIEAHWVDYVRNQHDSYIDDYEIIKDSLSKDYKGIYIPNSLVIKTFEVNSEFGKIWLDTIDAGILGLQIAPVAVNGREEDSIEYYNRIYDNPKLYKELFDSLKSKLTVSRSQLKIDFGDDYNTRVKVRDRDSKIQMRFSIYRDKDYKI
jgi:hypothetical protein